jgi:hypothetical protein
MVTQFKGPEFHGMASCWPELLAQARHTEFESGRFMHQLLLAETAEDALSRRAKSWAL